MPAKLAKRMNVNDIAVNIIFDHRVHVDFNHFIIALM